MFVFAAVYCLRSTGVMHDFCRWTNDKRVLGDDRQQRGPLRAQSGYLGRTADNICVYPNFVLSGEVREIGFVLSDKVTLTPTGSMRTLRIGSVILQLMPEWC